MKNHKVITAVGGQEVDASSPTPVAFYNTASLYEEFDLTNNLRAGADICNVSNNIDMFCTCCNSHSIFSNSEAESINHLSEMKWALNGIMVINLHCSRDKSHKYTFILKPSHLRQTGTQQTKVTLQKIGQYPSVATLSLFDVKKYSKVLSQKYYLEFTKAIGLVAHGVGVGSFVYLRRIFESLIEEVHQEHSSKIDWNEDTYRTAGMSEKIKILSTDLPEFLVNNKNLYGILSKGIHELSEEACLQAFPVVKLGIELILDDKIEQINKKLKVDSVGKLIAKLNSSI